MILFIDYSGCAGLHCCTGFSLVVGSRGHSLVAVRGLLTVAASLVSEHGLSGARTSGTVAGGLSGCSSQAPEHRFSSCAAQA